jgi:hypothetical protein
MTWRTSARNSTAARRRLACFGLSGVPGGRSENRCKFADAFVQREIMVVNPQNPANFRSNAYVLNPGLCATLSWNINDVNAC